MKPAGEIKKKNILSVINELGRKLDVLDALADSIVIKKKIVKDKDGWYSYPEVER